MSKAEKSVHLGGGGVPPNCLLGLNRVWTVKTHQGQANVWFLFIVFFVVRLG